MKRSKIVTFALFCIVLSGLIRPGGAQAAETTPPPPAYRLDVLQVGLGQVVRQPDSIHYPAGQVVQLEAAAEPGWEFTGWSGDASGSTAELAVMMDRDKTVTAEFRQSEYTLTVQPLGDGAIRLESEQPAYHYGDQVTLTAVPEPGSIFEAWGGSASGKQNPLTLTVTGDLNVTALFMRIPAALEYKHVFIPAVFVVR